MATGLKTTFELLSQTRNEAAASVLLSSLDVDIDDLRQGGLRALLARRSEAGQEEIVRRWPEWSSDDVAVIAENPGSLSTAIRDGVLGSDETTCRRSCAAAIAVGEFHAMPALVTAVEAHDGELQDEVGRTLVELAAQLQRRLAETADVRSRRDPENARRHAISSLEESIRRFPKHDRVEVLYAFLLLAQQENSLLKQILRDSLHSCFQPLIERIATDQSLATFNLLMRLLEDPTAPIAALRVIAKRYDHQYLDVFFAKVGHDPSRSVRKNLQKMRAFGWTANNCQRLLALNDNAQQAAVQVIIESGMDYDEKFNCLRSLLESGTPSSRRAATAALANFDGAEANDLILNSLVDDDPQVQANALGQLRQRSVPGAMATLIEAIDSEHDVVVNTAKTCLNDYSVTRYLAAFDSLNDAARQNTGALVAKVDSSTIGTLTSDMEAAARSRRIRAVEAAVAMGVVPELESAVIHLLDDEDHIVRTIAAGALSQSNTTAAKSALREALLDSSIAVQQAAQRSLEELALGRPITSNQIQLESVALPEVSGLSARIGELR